MKPDLRFTNLCFYLTVASKLSADGGNKPAPELVETFCCIKECNEMDSHFDGTPIAHPNWFALKCLVRGMIAAATCDLLGHRWIDNSYAGPDGAADDCHCERCGTGFHHTYF